MLQPDPLHLLVIHGQTFQTETPVDQSPDPSEHDAGPAPGCAGAASARQSLSPVRADAECCSSDPPTGRLGARTPGIDPAEHRRLCDVAPGSEVSLG